MLYFLAELFAVLLSVTIAAVSAVAFWANQVTPQAALPKKTRHQCKRSQAGPVLATAFSEQLIVLAILAYGLRYQVRRLSTERRTLSVLRRAAADVEMAAPEGAPLIRPTGQRALGTLIDWMPEWPYYGMRWTADLGGSMLFVLFLGNIHLGAGIYLGIIGSPYLQGHCSAFRPPLVVHSLSFVMVAIWMQLTVLPWLLLIARAFLRDYSRARIVKVAREAGIEPPAELTRRGKRAAPQVAPPKLRPQAPPGVLVVAYVPSLAEWEGKRLSYPPHEVQVGEPLCCICYEEFRAPSPINIGTHSDTGIDPAPNGSAEKGHWHAEPLWELPCKHTFHENCCAEWFALSALKRCPYCNQPLADANLPVPTATAPDRTDATGTAAGTPVPGT